jgi:hypothetical protein
MHVATKNSFLSVRSVRLHGVVCSHINTVGTRVLGETVPCTWDVDLSLVTLRGFGSVMRVPVHSRSHLYGTVWNVVCAGVIYVPVP